MVVGWHSGAKSDAKGRPRVIDYKTTADIWWRKEHDNVEMGADEDLQKLSYYRPKAAAAPLDYDPLAQFPGMSPEESFQLDISGFLLLRGVLTTAEAAAVQQVMQQPPEASDGADPLADHPVLQRCLLGMCGDGFRQDTRCTPIAAAAPVRHSSGGGGGVPLSAVGPPDSVSGKDYFGGAKCRGLMPVFRGVRVIWALRGAPAITVVPASHLNAVDTPECVRLGQDHLGASQVLQMEAGDLLLCAATLLHGVNPPPPASDDDAAAAGLLISCEYVCARTAPTAGYEPSFPTPGWIDELSPAQRAVISARES
eukprot:COSAG05_NODE_4367_length_1548_cov_4.889579_1_plen_310_part_10